MPFVWAVLAGGRAARRLFLPLLLARQRALAAGFHRPQVRAALADGAGHGVELRHLSGLQAGAGANAGVSPRTTSFTLPLGATLNMDGSALYQSILLIFMAQLAGAEV
jgi:hypothetical protein